MMMPQSGTTLIELFDRTGRALFGDHYVAPMGDFLGVDKTSVTKWRNGKMPVPSGVWRMIVSEVEQRERVLGLLRNDLVSVAAPRTDGRVDVIGPHFPSNASGMFVADCGERFVDYKIEPIVVAHNHKTLTVQLSREVSAADLDGFRRSFEAFTESLELEKGIVGAKGPYMKALLRTNLAGGQPRALRDWFYKEIDRINAAG